MLRSLPSATPATAATANHLPRLLPLGALAAGFGLFHVSALAQTTPAASAPASSPTPGNSDAALPTLSMKVKPETDDTSLRATTSTIGRGNQALRDIPQSVTVVTEKLIDDRRIDTLKQALHQTAGVSFMAAEGGEEDIRLRGFSLAASGDIYVDSLRDPAFYERDTFSYDRIELLRGSASMLFGRGSTGGVVNQVSKRPFLANAGTVEMSAGSGDYLRFTGDFNLKLGATTAARVNVMDTNAENYGNGINKRGIAPTVRWGIGTSDEITLSGYYLHNDNGINYGLPWVRVSSQQTSANPSTINSNLDPRNYYQASSDYNVSEAQLATLGHVHRFGDGGELKSSIRQGAYDRDQRAGTIRFCQRTVNATTGAVNNPDCPTTLPGLDTINAATRLVENGPNNKVQDMATTYAQSDYSNSYTWLGRKNDLLTGIDLSHEIQHAYAMVVPPGVTLNKNATPITLGDADNTNSVDERLRSKRLSGRFDAKALGIYAQDLVEITPQWKILGGLRWDYFKGDYQRYVTTATTATPDVGASLPRYNRNDSLWSKRAGLLYQPTATASFHFSYGTSFNTSGDTYQYDSQTTNTPPESSENYELGARIDAFDGRLSTRAAAFYSVKNHERNRDSDSAATQAVLSGKRHAAGLEFDLAGRITSQWEVYGSYAWIPVARIDVGAPGSVAGVAEGAGTRSSLTPRHSGTVWTTYQLLESFRVGGGLNARSSETPNRNPAGVVGPSYVTGDLMAEYILSDMLAFKLNVLNVRNKAYADALYTGHYIPGAPRSYQLTVTARF